MDARGKDTGDTPLIAAARNGHANVCRCDCEREGGREGTEGGREGRGQREGGGREGGTEQRARGR